MLRHAVAILLCLAAVPAAAEPDEMHKHTTRFWAAKLMESADGDLEKAAQVYVDLSNLEGPETATLRRDVLLQLAHLRLNQGDLAGARQALARCHRITTSGEARINTDECLFEARKVAVRENAVHDLPVRWTFDDDSHGFVIFGKGGRATTTQGSLIWRQEIGQDVGRLVVGMQAPTPSPVGVRMSVRSEDLAANLSLIVRDVAGNVYWEPKPFLTGARTRTVEVLFADLTPWDESMPPLNPSGIVELEFQDTTELLQRTQYTPVHRIVIDQFEIY